MLKNILFQNTPVFYTIVGSGSPVLLLHGFGEDGTIWQNQIAALQADYQLLIPDIPGSGLSPALPGTPGIDSFAEAMASILLAEQIASCTILGHSMGGYIALAMAEKYPHLLTGLGLIHSTAFADTEAKKEARQKSIAFIQANGALAFLKTSIPALFSPAFADDNPPIVEKLVQKAGSFTANTLVQYYQAMILRPDRSAILQQLKCPLLLLAGELDTAVPFDQSLMQSYVATETHLHFLRKSAHMGMLEETERFNRAIAGFLGTVYTKNK
jgi:pimeloyl-ACP methyl ester carboxylesterase